MATTLAADSTLPPPLLAIRHLLACPVCRAELRIGSPGLVCTGCQLHFPVRDGIAELARGGGAETWAREGATASSREYQQEYQLLEAAVEYNLAYQTRLFKRWTTSRERRLLTRLLESQPRSATLLDLPCGGGRLSRLLARHADLLIEADIARGQLLFAQRRRPLEPAPAWLTASAFHIPLADHAVDGVVCCRLCHHLVTAEERRRLLGELLRVSRRFVVMSFFDFDSLKNLLRRLRRPLDRKPPKLTMTRAEVARIAEAHGALLAVAPPLSRLFSGHRYALITRPAVARP